MVFLLSEDEIFLECESVTTTLGTSNPWEICDKLNIFILYSELGKVECMSQVHNGFFVIHVSKFFSDIQFFLAHELGHYFLHRDNDFFKLINCTLFLGSDENVEADLFAEKLLTCFHT